MSVPYNDLNEWKDGFLKNHVQPHDTTKGDFLSSESTILVAGPPKFDENNVNLKNLVPVGLLQNIQVSQQKQLMHQFEIGSRKPYFIPGRTMINVGMSRVLFDGPSLLYALSMQPDATKDFVLPEWNSDADGLGNTERPTLPDKNFSDPTINEPGGESEPGLFFMNLASRFFNQALGLGLLFFDGSQQAYSGFYLEELYIQNHTLSIASQQTILVENISATCVALRPLKPDTFPGSVDPTDNSEF